MVLLPNIMYELTCYIFINNIYKLKFLSSALLGGLKGSDIKLSEESRGNNGKSRFTQVFDLRFLN